MKKKRVIIVTDGDHAAEKALRIACKNVGAHLLTLTSGNPSRLNGEQVLFIIKSYPYDPIVIMADDGGWVGEGRGESIIAYLLQAQNEIEILGVVAVASATRHTRGTKVEYSLTRKADTSNKPVNKLGYPEPGRHHYLEGDTTELLLLQNNIRIIGCGDLGKMDWQDNPELGAPVTTACLQTLINAQEAVEL